MATPEDRLMALEIRNAEQEKTIEELSAQLAVQWKTVERLEKTVEELARRLVGLEEQVAPTPPVTRPPHW